MKEDFVRINVAFIPPKEVVDAVQVLSAEISKVGGSHFILDSQNFYPHITIYPPEYPTENIKKVLIETKKAVEILSSARLSFKKITVEEGYLGVEFNNTEEVKNIHRYIVNKLNCLREGHIGAKYVNEEGKFSKDQKSNIEKYGYPALLDLYKPHLTITRLKDENLAENVAKIIKWPMGEFVVSKIGVFKTGRNGTCVEPIKELSLN